MYMDYSKYIKIPNVEVPDEIDEKLKNSKISITPFKNINDILYNENLQKEIGYRKFNNGNYLVSMVCPMPNVTKEMVDWWFWWHPQNNIRYRLWYPGEHYSINYAKGNKEYFSCIEKPEFEENTQYPVERIGKLYIPLSINFKSPTNYGFTKKAIEDNNVATIVCGNVGAFRNLISHTEMAHIFFQKEEGLYMISRFWLGERLKNPILRKYMLTDQTAYAMARHCCIEYRNFAKKIPILYKEING